MDLGIFSVSLSVTDIQKSLEFYQALGFEIIDGGHMRENFKDTDTVKWRMLEKDGTKIGIFQGMFGKNTLSFDCKSPDDVVAVENQIMSKGIEPRMKTKPDSPMKSLMLEDPDGNVIMFGQM